MADFQGTILTQQGRNLLAKALTGANLDFTKVSLGDGVWDSSINPEQLTNLVSPKVNLPIQDLVIQGDGTAKLRVVLTNTGLTQGFFTRELGIFANDPDLGEILYAVAYANNPDFIPSDGVVKIEDVLDIYTVVSTAQNVTAVISDTVVLATKEDVNNAITSHNTDTTAHTDIRNEITNLQNNKASIDLNNITSLGKILDFDGSGSGLDADFVRGLPADFQNNFGTAGYQKLPSGLIIQWGVTTSSGTRTYATFPIAFPNTVLSLTYSERSRQDWNTYIVSLSNTGFTAGVDGGGGMPSVFYIAIGY